MDQKLLFLINRQWTGPVLDRFMAWMSSYDAWIWPIVIAALLTLWRGGFRARAFILATLLIVGINDGVVARTLKRVVDRPRPHQAMNDVRMVRLAKTTPQLLAVFQEPVIKYSRPAELEVEGRSFPSGHTINTISVALLAACFYPRRGWLAFIPALLVGYSRIYTGSHWPSDVLTSTVLGIGSTLLLLSAFEWMWRNVGAHLFPALHQQHPSLLAA